MTYICVLGRSCRFCMTYIYVLGNERVERSLKCTQLCTSVMTYIYVLGQSGRFCMTYIYVLGHERVKMTCSHPTRFALKYNLMLICCNCRSFWNIPKSKNSCVFVSVGYQWCCISISAFIIGHRQLLGVTCLLCCNLFSENAVCCYCRFLQMVLKGYLQSRAWQEDVRMPSLVSLRQNFSLDCLQDYNSVTWIFAYFLSVPTLRVTVTVNGGGGY